MSLSVKPFAAALLAGGRSSRMGQDKAWLDWGGEPLWSVQWKKLASVNPTALLLSCREEQNIHPSLGEVLFDPPDNAGPLPAILRCLEKVNCPLLVLAVDMPEITAEFLFSLLHQAEQDDTGLIFRGDNGYEPLCAIYTPAVLPLLKAAVAENNLRLQSFARNAVIAGVLKEKALAHDDHPFFLNLNHPADYSCNQPSLSK